MTHTLTPADVMSLRTSLHSRSSDGTFALALPPFALLNAEGLWELHAYGRLQALSDAPAIIMSAIEREHTEPGFIADLLNPATGCETVLRPAADKHAQAATLAARNATLSAARTAADEAAEEAAYRIRRAKAFNPIHVTLADLD